MIDVLIFLAVGAAAAMVAAALAEGRRRASALHQRAVETLREVARGPCNADERWDQLFENWREARRADD